MTTHGLMIQVHKEDCSVGQKNVNMCKVEGCCHSDAIDAVADWKQFTRRCGVPKWAPVGLGCSNWRHENVEIVFQSNLESIVAWWTVHHTWRFLYVSITKEQAISGLTIL